MSRAKDPITNLTPQQEQLAQLLAAPKPPSQHDAYIQAGYSPNSLPKTIDEEASRLANTPKVAARIRELKTRYEKATIKAQAWNLDRLIAEAEQQLEIARTGGWKAVASGNGALEIIGRATGLLTHKLEVTTQTLDASPLAGLNLEELRQLAAQRDILIQQRERMLRLLESQQGALALPAGDEKAADPHGTGAPLSQEEAEA